ncbi:MAG: YbaK/EbsC family protein [Promethearchaeota archaeon]
MVTIPNDKKLDLNVFRRIVNALKIRFAESKDLFNMLGFTPGAVSPTGLVNDIENKTIFIIDKEVWNADEICCHPNINSETMQIPGSDFQKLIEATGNILEIKELPYSNPLTEE